MEKYADDIENYADDLSTSYNIWNWSTIWLNTITITFVILWITHKIENDPSLLIPIFCDSKFNERGLLEPNLFFGLIGGSSHKNVSNVL